MEQDVLPGQQRLCPLRVQHSQGVVECDDGGLGVIN